MPTVISGSALTLPGDAVSSLQAVTKQQITSLMPAGAVLPFAMSSAPTGWLKCNGDAVSRTLYPTLFSAIGTTFGAGDGTTTFNLPDLRGEFIRGWADNKTTVDSGRVIGSGQEQQTPDHYHPVDLNQRNSSSDSGSGGLATGNQAAEGYIQPLNSNSPTLAPGVPGSVGTENRPRNVALLYCIKT